MYIIVYSIYKYLFTPIVISDQTYNSDFSARGFNKQNYYNKATKREEIRLVLGELSRLCILVRSRTKAFQMKNLGYHIDTKAKNSVKLVKNVKRKMSSCKCHCTAARYTKTQEPEENQFFILSAVFYCLRVPSPRLLKFENVAFKVTELKKKKNPP